jgi:ATP-dependent helicase/nuclease subunit A
LAKGSAVHALLQHLPDLDPARREAAALRFLRDIGDLRGQADAVWAQVREVLAHPDLAELFGPGSRAEVPLAGVVGDAEIGGLVDRLAVSEDAVWIADYKTDRAPPETAEGTPARYLRQLAAYKAILSQIYPGRDIHCLLIWTSHARAMTVPPALLSRHAPA